MTSEIEASSAVDAAAMRDVLGHFPSGVAIVTARAPDGPVGFTCQSFASLSLDPPLVVFCAGRTSQTWPRIRRLRRFCVNVLAEQHERHSGAFARSGSDKFAGVDWSPAPSGAPIIDGVCAWIDCALRAEYDGGDHVIVVALVHALGADSNRPPMLFHRGAYGLREAGRDDERKGVMHW